MKKIISHIIAGKIKGKKIVCPTGEIRPLTAKVREALFNIIGNCTGKTMLDLFSGSASISIEAFSRGLNSADIVEKDRGKKDIIIENIKNAGFENGNLFIADAFNYCRSTERKYDIIMLDPPFKMPNKIKLLKIISARKLLTDNGFLIIHLHKKEILPDTIDNLNKYDYRKYGINSLWFYR